MTVKHQSESVAREFSDEVHATIAARAADRCANPGCRALTGGAAHDRMKSLNMGVAVRIATVESRGRRYDAALSPDACRHETNAIWLCRTCAVVVDSDVARYTPDLLRGWKQAVEAAAMQGRAVPLRTERVNAE
jgi:hypothetical protein